MNKQEEIEEVEEDIIKVRVRPHKQFFPKYEKEIENGDFGIIAWRVEEILEGEPVIHPIFKTLVTKGVMCEFDYDEVYTVTARGEEPQGGRDKQYNLLYIGQPADLKTVEEQRIFLNRILTEKQVADLFVEFDDPLEHIKNGDREKLMQVKGVGEVTADRIIAKYGLTKDNSRIYVELEDYNLTDSMIARLISRYNSSEVIIDKITSNPYILATELDGVGFVTADEMALNNGLEWDNVNRIKAFIEFRLGEEAEKGNSFIEANFLMYEIEDALGSIEGSKIGEAMNTLVESGIVGLDEVEGSHKRVYLKRYKRLERRVSDELLRILGGENSFKATEWESSVRELEEKQGWEHTDEQWEGIKLTLDSQITVITGASGVGKTTIVKAMIKAMKGQKIAQCALSGKAAANLTDVTGVEGSTIHRLLGYNPAEGYHYNEKQPLPHDVVIVDEISMVDAKLFLDLLVAIQNGCRLVCIGDINQLENIGFGNVAVDMMSSVNIPVVTLTEIHRQAKKSAIITEAHKIKDGVQITDSAEDKHVVLGELQDLELDLFNKKGDEFITKNKILKHFRNNLDKVSDITELQVIVPMRYRGNVCTYELNKDLQNIYNPRKVGETVTVKLQGDRTQEIRLKDKVMIMRNNYNTQTVEDIEREYYESMETGEKIEPNCTPIYNGDVGIVQEIKENGIVVNISRIGEIFIDIGNLKHVELAYASTVHKCVTGDTWLRTSKGLKQIKELDNGAKVGELRDFDGDILVDNGKYMESPSKFYNAGVGKCVKIATKRGYEVEVTLDHKCFIMGEDGYIKEILAKDVKQGDNFIVSKGDSGSFGSEVNLPPEWGVRNLNVRSIEHKRPAKMTRELAKLIGMIMADGCLGSGSVNFSKRYEEVTLEFVRLIKLLFGYEGTYKLRPSGDYMCYISSKDILQFFENIGGIQPHEKYVPKCILEGSKEIQIEFLKGCFEDGSVNIKKGRFDHIELSLHGKVAIKQIQQMLLGLGVISSVRHYNGKRGNSLTLYVYKQDAEKLIDVGFDFISDFKRDRLRLAKADIKKSERNAIHYIPQIMKKIKDSYDISVTLMKTGYNDSIRINRMTNEMLGRFLQSCVDDGGGVLECDDYKYLKYIHDELYFDDIVDIEQTEAHTYCLTMPETHRFVQNGFILGNCQGSGYEVTICGVDYSSYVMLSRESLYTMITRTKNYCVLVAELSALEKAIDISKTEEKRSFLREMLDGKI